MLSMEPAYFPRAKTTLFGRVSITPWARSLKAPRTSFSQ